MSSIAFPCPSCGTQYELTRDYLAQYGGQSTTCQACQAPMNLPTLSALSTPPPLPPPQAGPMAVLPYAGGYQPLSAGGGVTVEGNLVVAPTGGHLPPLCVKCGEPAGDKQPFRRVLYWHHPGLFVLVCWPIIYIIVALCVRKRAVVHYWLCDDHLTARRNYMLGGWFVVAMGVLSLVAFGMEVIDDRGALAMVGMIGVIAGLIIVLVSARTLSPQRIDSSGFVWLRGTVKAFRAKLSAAGSYGAPQYGSHYAPPQGVGPYGRL